MSECAEKKTNCYDNSKSEVERLDSSFDDGETAAESVMDYQELDQPVEKKELSAVDVFKMDMDWLSKLPFHSRQLIGEAILSTVAHIVRNHDLSLKITGMLIDLPVDEMYAFVKDYNVLFLRVQEAFWALEYQRLRMDWLQYTTAN